MRQIQVEDGLRVRFPGRDDAFDEGVEIGLLLASMASGRPRIAARISEATLDQARDLGVLMGYRIVVEQTEAKFLEITCCSGRSRPALALVGGHDAARSQAGAGG
jgi:hypothetical protein